MTGTDQALLGQVDDLLDRVQRQFDELRRVVENNLRWVPGWIADQVQRAWGWMCDRASELWSLLSEVVSNMGSPGTLWDTAAAWVDSVGSPVSAQYQTVAAGSLSADDRWNGSAADAYRQVLPLQQAAIDKIRTNYAEAASTALGDVATALLVFFGALVSALLALVVGIISAVASSATIVGLPAGPFIAGGAAAVAAGAVTVGVLNLENATNKADLALRQKVHDDSAYPGGHWPVAVRG